MWLLVASIFKVFTLKCEIQEGWNLKLKSQSMLRDVQPFSMILNSFLCAYASTFHNLSLTWVLSHFFCSWRFFEFFKVEEKERGKQTEAQWRHKYKFWCTEPGNESFWDGELLNICSRTKLLCYKALNTSGSLPSFWSQTKCMKWCLYKTQGYAILGHNHNVDN